MKTDSEIQKDVMDELKLQPILDASEIGVAVKNGVVTLSGFVDVYQKKVAAELATKKVIGVEAIIEDIDVRLPESRHSKDLEIAKTVLNALKWNSSVREDKIKVKVENGLVTLDGEVDWGFQSESAYLTVANLIGVKHILNRVIIKEKIGINDIKDMIEKAFQRNALLDSNKIDIDIAGSKIILSGKVRSTIEKNDAEKAVWEVPGIAQIENRIEVDGF